MAVKQNYQTIDQIAASIALVVLAMAALLYSNVQNVRSTLLIQSTTLHDTQSIGSSTKASKP